MCKAVCDAPRSQTLDQWAARDRRLVGYVSFVPRPSNSYPISSRRLIVIEMGMRGPNQKLGLLAAMVVMIMLFALPSRADAHAGHGGHAPAASTSVPESEPLASSEKTSKPISPNLRLVVSAADTATGQSPSGCVGDRCCSASHACCAFTLSNPPSDDGPVWIRARTCSATIPVPTGRDPTALRKPPKTFA